MRYEIFDFDKSFDEAERIDNIPEKITYWKYIINRFNISVAITVVEKRPFLEQVQDQINFWQKELDFRLANNLPLTINYNEQSLISPDNPLAQKIYSETFHSTLTPEQLQKLHSWLIEKCFIDSQTALEDFTAIFTGQPIDNIKNKIKWIKQAKNKQINKSVLIELFQLLSKYHYIPESEALTQKKQDGILFDLLTECFSDEAGNGLSFTVSNKSSSQFYSDIKDFIRSL